jgi:prepilin-type N-terminal cleavage/methylation domain-containing protein
MTIDPLAFFPARKQRIRSRRANAGLTLIELVTALAILAIVSVLAVPSFEDFRVRERLKGAANNLYTDLQFARSEAVQRNAQVTVSFVTGAGWCYGIHQGNAACDCATANSCSIKTVSGTDFPGISISQAQFVSGAGTADWYVIDPRRGQVVDAAGGAVAGTVVFAGAGSRSLRGDLNAVGRVKLCSPSGSMSGYPTC